MMINKKKLSLLHIGWGFYPWRKGGLILYARDLMYQQAKIGHDVSYFCAGRKYYFQKKPRIKKWRMQDIKVFEIINSKISHRGDEGTLFPEENLNESVSEFLFREVLNRIRPDIVHIHELAGLPSSIIDILVDEYRIPCLMTLADYFLICPTLKLFNHTTRSPCELSKVGMECQQCCEAAPKSLRNDKIETIRLLLDKIGENSIAKNKTWFNSTRKLLGNLYWKVKSIREHIFLISHYSPAEKIKNNNKMLSIASFQKRREVNILRLRKIPKLIARSKKVKEIYKSYIGSAESISVINPYLSHIDTINMKSFNDDIEVVKFVTLNGFVSEQKGGGLLSNAIIILNEAGYSRKFEVYAYGGMSAKYINKLKNQKNVFHLGEYAGSDLDFLLDDMHVGIVPSIWEEVFGYVGIELMAKGLPVIANCKGGITDYLVNNVTGRLNHKNSEDGLVAIMKEFIENPKMIIDINKNIKRNWSRNYEKHYCEIMDAYYDLIN